MKKLDVINLIKYHYSKHDPEFANQARQIAHYFEQSGDRELSQSILEMIDELPIGDGDNPLLVSVDLSGEPLPMPSDIKGDLLGITNAINHNMDINRFLFTGSPGTGKTESAKQIARNLNRKLLSVDFNHLVDSRLGKTSKNLSKLFITINNLPNLQDCIILFDEIDIIALDRINQNDVREMGRVTPSFLRKLDRLNPDAVILATTNLHKNLDKALARRFDANIDFDRYSKEDKINISVAITDSYLQKFDFAEHDEALLRRVLKSADDLPNPGDLANIIKISLAFSDTKDRKEYLRRIYWKLHEQDSEPEKLKNFLQLMLTV